MNGRLRSAAIRAGLLVTVVGGLAGSVALSRDAAVALMTAAAIASVAALYILYRVLFSAEETPYRRLRGLISLLFMDAPAARRHGHGTAGRPALRGLAADDGTGRHLRPLGTVEVTLDTGWSETVARPVDTGTLVEMHSRAPLSWHGEIVSEADAGPLLTRQAGALTIWAPSGTWLRACNLVAMCGSVRAEECLVLTDAPPPLDTVPSDARIVVVARGVLGAPRSGTAPYLCSELRSDRVFRLLLAGRAHRRPELAPLLRHHVVARGIGGRHLLERWEDVLPALFEAGPHSLPEGLRRDLNELAEVARDLEHAVVGGFHALDPLTRGPAHWESGARRYLPIAAARSEKALALVEHWLASNAGWQMRSPRVQEGLRCMAAVTLYWLADDPWLSAQRADELHVAGLLS